jgi:cysteinyl-tRNA synthetase
MAAKYLGTFFDIHCGGEDHIMVHHPNEIAQMQACHNTRLANFWLHGYFLQLDGLKMSKSSGDFLRLQTIIDRGYDPLVYRYFCLGGHYRAKLTFNWQAMDGAATALQRLRTAVTQWPNPTEPDDTYLTQFTNQINDDLNMPRALAVMWNLVKSDLPDGVKKATLLVFDQILGLGMNEWQAEAEQPIPEAVQSLVGQRQEARAHKEWQQADALRDQIAAAGYDVVDTPNGPELKRRLARA